MICVTYGRPAMISQNLASTVLYAQCRAYSQENKDCRLLYDEFVARAFELYEITNHAAQGYFSPSQFHGPNTDRSGVLDPSPTEEKLAFIIQIDGCLSRWKNSLPAHLVFGNTTHQSDDVCRRQTIVLHLR